MNMLLVKLDVELLILTETRGPQEMAKSQREDEVQLSPFPECQWWSWEGLIFNEKPLVVSWWSRKPPGKNLVTKL